MEDSLEKYFGTPIGNTEIPTSGAFALDATKDLFIAHADGNGMINEGIKDGDTLIIEKCQNIKNNEIAVVWYNDKTYIKIYRKFDDGTIELAYADGHTPSIIIPKNCTEYQIIGKLYAVFRTLY